MEKRRVLYNYTTMTERLNSDERKKLEQPAYEKTYEGEEILLTKDFSKVVKNNDFLDILENRKSTREYAQEPITLDELAYILWYTYGVKAVLGTKRKATLRTVPSAGARHSLELYFIANNVEGLQEGLYHYNGVSHGITLIKSFANAMKESSRVASEQTFVENANVLFIWSCIPYRMEWRYPEVAIKYALIDVGHACENLYLAAASIDCGVCAIGDYMQDLADGLLELPDNGEEVTVYMAALGKKVM